MLICIFASGSRAQERGALRLLNYAVCEISGKQYKVTAGKAIEVNFQGDKDRNVEAKVLLLSEDGKLKIGKPYLKENLTLKHLGSSKGIKIRVSKFHAKANYRKTIGFRAKITKVMLAVKKS